MSLDDVDLQCRLLDRVEEARVRARGSRGSADDGASSKSVASEAAAALAEF